MTTMPETAGAESASPARNSGIMPLLGTGHCLMPLPAPPPAAAPILLAE